MKRILTGAWAVLGLFASAAVLAQDYPNKPIRLMMPNAPGSSNDTLARIVVAPAELPVGLVTAAIGAPFFAVLLMREKARLAA